MAAMHKAKPKMMKKDTVDIRWTTRAFFAALISLVLFAGCSGIGPPTVDRDRFDYVSAISESWKRQTLLNLIKTRYLDAPVFMDVTSVISQYALEGEIEMGFEWDDADTQTLGGGRAMYTDRPTISYAPLIGENFARSLLRPIPIGTVLLLVQSGYPIDYVLRICIQGINGLDNRSSRISPQNGDPEFYELLSLLRQIQQTDRIRMRSRIIDNKEVVVMFFREPKTEVEAKNLKKALNLLGLRPEAREFRIVHGYLAENDSEISILSRSMIQIMSDYSSYIDVPDSDITEGRVSAANREGVETQAQFQPLIRVGCSVSEPEDAFVAVPYRNHWFFIDDRDINSKRTFYFLMVMFSFTERSDAGRALPVLTVPTN